MISLPSPENEKFDVTDSTRRRCYGRGERWLIGVDWRWAHTCWI